MQHYDSTSLTIIECNILNSFGHNVASCCTKFDLYQTFDVTSFNISFLLTREQSCIRLAAHFNIVILAHAQHVISQARATGKLA